MKVNRMVQTNHHADARPLLALPACRRRVLARLRHRHLVVEGGGGGRLAGARGQSEAPQVVHPRHGADEVAVRHVGQRREVRLVAAVRRDAAARFDPLSCLFGVWVR